MPVCMRLSRREIKRDHVDTAHVCGPLAKKGPKGEDSQCWCGKSSPSGMMLGALCCCAVWYNEVYRHATGRDVC